MFVYVYKGIFCTDTVFDIGKTVNHFADMQIAWTVLPAWEMEMINENDSLDSFTSEWNLLSNTVILCERIDRGHTQKNVSMGQLPVHDSRL